MPLPTIPNVYRCSFTFGASGQIAVNVIHLHRSASTASAVWNDIKTIGDANFDTVFNPWAAMDNDYVILDLTVLPLDGVSASVSGLPDEAWHGGGSGQRLPAMAQIVHFGTDTRGPRGRGRVFIGPIVEGEVTEGLMENSVRAGTALNWINFADALDAEGLSLVVASYVHEDFNEVTAISAQSVPGIQRRRNERLAS